MMLSLGLARTDNGDIKLLVALVARQMRDYILSHEVLWDPMWV